MGKISVLAGINGAGKSSVFGVEIRESRADYFNPDEIARKILIENPAMPVAEANSVAWLEGKKLLEHAIEDDSDFAFETTLGGGTIPRLLREAADKGCSVRILYVGLASVDLHLARVKARVAKGGHDIPETDIRRRWEASMLNLIALMPKLTALRVFDNSADGDPISGNAPSPVLVLEMKNGAITSPPDLSKTPTWAKPLVATAIKQDLQD
ncbi:MAG: zeta toxin family protein [Chthoniobacterales bacterium]